MNPRALRHRIKIQSRIENRDAAGGIDFAWADYAEVWAAIEPARVVASFAAAQLQRDFDTLITIRYLPGMRTSMRILFERYDGTELVTKTYEVMGVRLVDEIQYEMLLQCLERQADGWRKG